MKQGLHIGISKTNLLAGVGRAVAALLAGERKVRTSKGRVPGNAWKVQTYGKCHRKYTA